MGYYKWLVTDNVSDNTRRKNRKKTPSKPFPYETVRLSPDEVPLEQATREFEEYLRGDRKYPTYRLHREEDNGWLLSLIGLEPPEPTIEWVWTLRRPIRKPPKAKRVKHSTTINIAQELANLEGKLKRKARVKNNCKFVQGALVQEAMLAIWKSAPTYKGCGTFSAWANSVAEKSMDKWFRQRASQWSRETPQGWVTESGVTVEHDALTALEQDDEQQEDWEATVRRLHTALAIVPDSDLVVQRYVDGMSYSSMARRLGVGEPALRKRVQRVKDTLRKVIEGLASQ